MLKSPKNPQISLVLEKPCEVALLTVDNYCKWYDVWIVFPDGRIQAVPFAMFWEGQGTGWHDHIPDPKACLQVAEKLKIEWHAESLEMIVGRFMMEKREKEWQEILDTL